MEKPLLRLLNGTAKRSAIGEIDLYLGAAGYELLNRFRTLEGCQLEPEYHPLMARTPRQVRHRY